MHTAVATSLTPSETDASTDATTRPQPALFLAYGAEHVPIRRARTVRTSFRCRFSMRGMSGKGHSRTYRGRLGLSLLRFVEGEHAERCDALLRLPEAIA